MKHRPALAVLAALVFLLCAIPCSAKIIYVKWDSPGPTFDGTSWGTAFHTVQAGLNAAVSGDEVWVARGTYVQVITLKGGAALYGGFAGTETSRDQRNTRVNPTILDCRSEDNQVVWAPSTPTAGTRLDGFTICNSAQSIRSNYPAVSCNAYMTIANTTIVGSAGAGIVTREGSSSMVITNNVIIGSGREGIRCSDTSSPTITNNTIIGNNQDGIYCLDGSAPTISNNIIAYNFGGIRKSSTSTPALRNNCVYSNGSYNYSGLSAGTGDISANPTLADRVYRNMHIQPTSPCRNAGWTAAPGLPLTDIDGQSRVQDGAVDIGADESDGTTWSGGPGIIVRVSPSGDDANSGSNWSLAKKTVQAGINAAWTLGGEVWVKSGTYTEPPKLRAYVYVYGGFAGTETSRSARNIPANQTTIAGSISARMTGYRVSALDGFLLRSPFGGHGIYCQYAGPIIANNTIISRSIGVNCIQNSSPLIEHNSIIGNANGAIVLDESSPTVRNNRIAGNNGGISCSNGSSPTITNNSVIVNNGGGIGFGDSCSPKISNNIVAFNSRSGMGRFATTGTPTLRNNCVYGNQSGNYLDVTPGTGDISADPLMADTAYGNIHIQPSSPCRNTGWNDAPARPSTDIDGQTRVQDGTVDIGADESDGTTWPAGPSIIVRVSTSGNDANDGSSWTSAKRTVQAAIQAASALGGDVWVKAGTYNELITLRALAYVYGGFAGTETSRSQRNWNTYETILDGGAAGPVVTIEQQGSEASTVDGLTIRNGRELSYQTGAGILCSFSSPPIRNNKIVANNGVGIACMHACTPVIANNIIAANTGAGIAVLACSPIITNNTIIGNTPSYGRGGIMILCESSPVITNNIVAFNSSGIWGGCDRSSPWEPSPPPPTPILRNNCVYGNTSGNYTTVTPGIGDISEDPLLVNRTGGDYHLTAASPCRNTGWNEAAGLPGIDIDGQGRICAGTVDIGADEHWTSTSAVSTAKSSADGTEIALQGFTVSAAFGGFFYIQNDDRSCGIRVDKAGHGVVAGSKVNISGTLATNADGERYIAAISLIPCGIGSIEAILLPNRSVGGGDSFYHPATGAGQKGQAGVPDLSNIGLLVATTGKVTYIGSEFFYLDDGSHIEDGSGHVGVRVNTEGQPMPALDSYVKVTGASSCYKRDGNLYRLIRATAIQ